MSHFLQDGRLFSSLWSPRKGNDSNRLRNSRWGNLCPAFCSIWFFYIAVVKATIATDKPCINQKDGMTWNDTIICAVAWDLQASPCVRWLTGEFVSDVAPRPVTCEMSINHHQVPIYNNDQFNVYILYHIEFTSKYGCTMKHIYFLMILSYQEGLFSPLCWQALQYGFWGLVSHGLVYSHRYTVQRQDLLLWGAGRWCRTCHDFVPRFHPDLKWGRGWTSSKLCTSNLFFLIWSQLHTLFCLYKCSFPGFCGSHLIWSLFDLALKIVTFNVNNCGVALASIPTSCWLHDYRIHLHFPCL